MYHLFNDASQFTSKHACNYITLADHNCKIISYRYYNMNKSLIYVIETMTVFVQYLHI